MEAHALAEKVKAESLQHLEIDWEQLLQVWKKLLTLLAPEMLYYTLMGWER